MPPRQTYTRKDVLTVLSAFNDPDNTVKAIMAKTGYTKAIVNKIIDKHLSKK